MKFGKFLECKARPEWAGYTIDYKALKDLVAESVRLCDPHAA